jgi:C-terminal processing protease CtpA/Prc
MRDRNITGTNDWKKYEFTLKMDPKNTTQIVFGAFLVGKGTMWVDDLSIQIDGRDISKAKLFTVYPASLDKEFDKGSGIELDTLSEIQIKNLKILGLVWGFVKYYHPAIAKGEYNWDYELIRILPKILAANNTTDRDKLLFNWISELGEFEIIKKEPDFSDAKMKPDLEWISNSGLSSELSDLLNKIFLAKRTNSNYYAEYKNIIDRRMNIRNENPYTNMIYPDAGFRIIALYRYWNIIQYFFPYKNLIEEDWKEVLTEFIPKVALAKDETSYILAILELIGRVHDTHANIWGANLAYYEYFGIRFTPIEVSFIENKLVITDFMTNTAKEHSGLQIGDIILSIDNKDVDDIIQERLPYTPASNYSTQLRNIAGKILRTNDSIINIRYSRGDNVNELTLKTYSRKELNEDYIIEPVDTCFKIIDQNIAYIHNGNLKQKYLPKIWKDLKTTKGLIIDDRNYPSDFPIRALSKYIVPKKTPFVHLTCASVKFPGLFEHYKEVNVGRRFHAHYKGSIVILVNESTQSSAEYHAMAYRTAPGAVVIGSTTAGADGDVFWFYLPGNIRTMISGLGVYYPDGTDTQRVGIVPDIEIKPTIEGIRQGRDEVLEKAIEVINAAN